MASRGNRLKSPPFLTDPTLDFVFREIRDKRKKEKITYKTDGGKEASYERPLSLSPTVTITDSAGKTVATGTMPFG